jgi:hypothetical protein
MSSNARTVRTPVSPIIRAVTCAARNVSGEPQRPGWRRAKLSFYPCRIFISFFALPAVIGAMAYQNKAKIYGLPLKAASETLMTIAADRNHLGADIGVIAVLHTWGQNLQHHLRSGTTFGPPGSPENRHRRIRSAAFFSKPRTKIRRIPSPCLGVSIVACTGVLLNRPA